MPCAYAESRSLVPVVSTAESEPNARAFDANAEPSAASQRGGQAGPGKVGKAPAGKNVKGAGATANSAAPALTKKAGAVAAKKPVRRTERQPTATYVKMRDSWHATIERPAELPTPPETSAFPPLVLVPVNGSDRVSVTPQTAQGGFSASAQREVARVLSPGRRKSPHPIAPHLLDLVYRAMRHFDAPLVHVISGYRADRAGSRHTQGRAIDFVLPGVSNEQLASYVQQFGFVGVGIYPNSGFVHLDVRAASFFWIDESLPDEKCRTQQILAEESKRIDNEARDRGEQPDFFVPNNEREDRAAARAYKQRAQRKAAAAEASRSL